MQLFNQIAFRESPKDFNYLKDNSYFFKELNRGTIDFKTFQSEMKAKYKERTTDKINSVMDNMELISSVLNVLK